MHDILKKPSVVILGAGFSAACTDGGMPLMRSYFDSLTKAEYPSLYGFVSDVSPDVATANVEEVLVGLDQVRHTPESILEGWGQQWKSGANQIERELSNYTLSRLSKSGSFDGENWAVRILASCNPTTTVISLNYDNIAESIMSCLRKSTIHLNQYHRSNGRTLPTCGHCRMRLILDLACSCTGKDPLDDRLWQGACLKLHGSIAWKRCINPDCCSNQCLVAHEQCAPFEPAKCPNCQQDCVPALVMPSMTKNLDAIPELRVMWEGARRAIVSAESILLFGFSMPLSDQLLTCMIRTAICANRNLRRVASIDFNPDDVLARFTRCLPGDLDVEKIPFAVLRDKSPEWIE